MFSTSEIRWFSKNKDKFSEIYDSIPGQNQIQPVRTDHYLKTYSDLLNVKLREGKVEIKWRTGKVNQVCMKGQILGEIENWTKISIGEQEPIQSNLDYLHLSQFEWIEIGKERQLKLFEITENDRVTPVSIGVLVENGCYVEFTKLTIDSSTYFTFNFEAFGSEDKTALVLTSTIQYCSGYTELNNLGQYSSQSYAEFLNGLKSGITK